MWEKFKRLKVNRDHTLVIPRGCQPGEWFGARSAVLAPLYRKRKLLISTEHFVYAWTLYNERLKTDEWEIPPDANNKLHFEIQIMSRKPSGWCFTIPQELRNKAWLPGSGGFVMCEYCELEMNFWTESAYNLESILEADE